MRKNENIISLLLSCIMFTSCTTHIMAPVITSKDNSHNSYKGPKSSPEFVIIKENDLPHKMQYALGAEEDNARSLIKENDISFNDINNDNYNDNDLVIEPSNTEKELDLELELTKLDLDDLHSSNKSKGDKYNKEESSNDVKPNLKKDTLPVDGVMLNNFGDIVDNKKLTGINIAAKAGSPVVAVRSGTVIHAKYDKTYGNIVIIENKDDKIHTAYAHLQNIVVHEGDAIRAGQVIGKVGNSGSKAVEPMLHFVVRHNKTPVDPITYLNLK